MKELLKQMLTGWVLHELAWDAEAQQHTREQEDCMTEACGGDELKGNLLVLFSHWDNDIASIAAHYGLEVVHIGEDGEVIRPDGTVDTLLKPGRPELREDVPPAPSPDCYWSGGVWVVPEPDADDAPVKGVDQ